MPKRWRAENLLLPQEKEQTHKRPKRDAIIVPTAEQIGKELDQLSNTNRYHTMVTPMLTAQFRASQVFRRDGTQSGVLDFDLTQIEIHEPYARKGNGVAFFRNLMKAAKKRNRGVYLEQCITKASQAWRRKLIELKLVDAYKPEIYGDFNAISVIEQ